MFVVEKEEEAGACACAWAAVGVIVVAAPPGKPSRNSRMATAKEESKK